MTAIDGNCRICQDNEYDSDLRTFRFGNGTLGMVCCRCGHDLVAEGRARIINQTTEDGIFVTWERC